MGHFCSIHIDLTSPQGHNLVPKKKPPLLAVRHFCNVLQGVRWARGEVQVRLLFPSRDSVGSKINLTANVEIRSPRPEVQVGLLFLTRDSVGSEIELKTTVEVRSTRSSKKAKIK